MVAPIQIPIRGENQNTAFAFKIAYTPSLQRKTAQVVGGKKLLQMKCLQGHDDGFTGFASFVYESDQEEPFSEQDLRAIEAIEARFQSSLPSKRPFNPTLDHPLHPDVVAAAAAESTPRRGRRRRRLPGSLLALQHPNAFSLTPCQGHSRMRLPVMKFSGQIMYSRTFDEVEKAVSKLWKILEEKKREMVQLALGFDIEWRPTFRKGVPPGKVAVMQICGGTSLCHVLHIIHSGIPQNLQLLLEDPIVLKVGAGIGSDATKVFKDYDISIKGVEDLSLHANQKLGGGPQKWGLASLAEKLLSKQLRKPSKIRLGNWETYVLSKEQLEYAATDAFASWYLYQAIKDLPYAKEVIDESGEVVGMPQEGPNF